MKKLLITIVVILLLIGIAVFVFFNLSGASTKGKKVDYSLPATELFTSFDTNENAANKKYIGKIVEVSGKVISTEIDANGATVVLLDGGNGMDAIMCTLTQGEEKHLASSQKNVTIRGLCAGKTMDVILNKGLLVR